MENEIEFTDIVQAAMSGDQPAIEELIKRITPRIRTYIYRSSLNPDITEEILQEVYIKMLESMDKLRDVNAFWPWLYRVTSNCINSFYRARSKTSNVSLQDELLESIVGEHKTSDADLMNKELGKAVIKAVATLKPRHRQMVTLRCFESMSFKEISEIEETTEIYARVLYHRAIEKLRVALKKRGFSKASLVLALTMFGKMTAPTEAAVLATSVSASTVTGVGAAKGGLIASKIAKTAGNISVHNVRTASVAVAVGVIAVVFSMIGPFRSNVTSVHYDTQGVRRIKRPNPNSSKSSDSSSSIPAFTATNSSSSSSTSSTSSSVATLGSANTAKPKLAVDRANIEYRKQAYFETKLLMPDGPDGHMMLFMQRWGDTQKTDQHCSWLQDGNANYYHAIHKNSIFITNDPLRMLILPTDPDDMVKFMYSQLGFDSRFSRKRNPITGLTQKSIDNRVAGKDSFQSEHAYNTFEADDLLNTWPKDVKKIDMRDEMHKRGWTFFEVSGYINDKYITGTGKLPFVFNKYKEHKPWISIKAADEVFTDYPGQPAVAISGGKSVAYANESFFEGFCRPWDGFTCLDSVMRDAAKRRLRFSLKYPNKEMAEVSVFADDKDGTLTMVYDIDRNVDVIRGIKYFRGDEMVGGLNFNYIQDESELQDSKFNVPKTETSARKTQKSDIPWLFKLAAE